VTVSDHGQESKPGADAHNRAKEIRARQDFADFVWDLRNDAYDNRSTWDRVDAEAMCQALAEAAERRTGGEEPSWRLVAALLDEAAMNLTAGDAQAGSD